VPVELIGVGGYPEAAAVEVPFADEAGPRHVVHAVGPFPESVLAATQEEAEGYLGCEVVTDWRAA
jgi:hypothetical protein